MSNQQCCSNPKKSTHKDNYGNWIQYCTNCGADEDLSILKESLKQNIFNYRELITKIKTK